MPAFILCGLALSFLVQSESPYLLWLASDAALITGLFAAAAALLGGLLKKLPSVIWFDGFAVGTLLIWFAYWRRIFNDDAPMFYFYPLYFSVLSAVLGLLFINKAEHFDDESLQYLRYLDRYIRIPASAFALFVLLSLAITRHYTLFPMAMTLFIARHMLTRCVEIADN